MTNVNTRINALEAGIAAILTHLGAGTSPVTQATPKTTARVQTRETVTPMAVKSNKRSLLDDVEIVITEAMADGRMKLPARMFNGRTKCTVEGHTFTQQPADQNRSTKFNPAIFGASEGDTVVFSHTGGSNWEVEVAGTRKRKASAKTVPAKVAPKAKAVVAAKPTRAKAVPASDDEYVNPAKGITTAKELARVFGKIAVKQANEGFSNENIVGEDDPRQYLNSRQNAQAKRVWLKTLGMTRQAWVKLLAAEVWD